MRTARSFSSGGYRFGGGFFSMTPSSLPRYEASGDPRPVHALTPCGVHRGSLTGHLAIRSTGIDLGHGRPVSLVLWDSLYRSPALIPWAWRVTHKRSVAVARMPNTNCITTNGREPSIMLQP